MASGEVIELSAINIYPVKSCAGLSLDEWCLSSMGLQDDRRFMIVDTAGQMLTQRKHTALHAVRIHRNEHSRTYDLSISPDRPAAMLRGDPKRPRQVQCWQDDCMAWDCGDEAAELCSALLGQAVRVVELDPAHERAVETLPGIAPAITSFSDGFPLLLISEASLADLNQRLERAVPMHRFRPNLVVRGCDAFAEDTWREIRIGQLRFEVVKSCKRCVFTCVDQETGQRGVEPLKTLATYRKRENGIHFGQNLIHRDLGKLTVGDRLTVLR